MFNDRTRSLLSAIVESSRDAIYVTNLDGIIEFWNPGAQSLLGYSEAEIIDRSVQCIIPPDRLHEFDFVLTRLQQGLPVDNLETMRRHKDGTLIPVSLRISPIRDDRGEVVMASTIARDISERQAYEARLRQQAALLDLSKDGIFSRRLDGTILSWNRGAELLYGYTAAEAIGCKTSELLLTEFPIPFETIVASLARDGFWAGDLVHTRRDGTRVHVSSRWALAPQSEDGVPLILESNTDIAERKRTEQEREDLLARTQRAHAEATENAERLAFLAQVGIIFESSLEFETTLQHIADLAVPRLGDWCAVDLLQADGSVRLVALSHVNPERAQWGRTLRDRYPVDLDAPTGLANVIRTGRSEFYPVVTDEMLVAAAKDERQLALLREIGYSGTMVVPLRVGDRTLGAMTLVYAESGKNYIPADLELAEELARRAALAIENARLYQEAQRAARLRDQFLTIASHELKTPLTTMLGYAELLQTRQREGDVVDPKYRRMMDTLVAQTYRLNKMISALLDVSRIESGRLALDRAPFDLNALIYRVVGEMQPQLDKHVIELAGAGTPLVIQGDELRIEQVLQNLLSNAVKYSPRGGPVRVELERGDDKATVRITDRGLGIPAHALPNIFQRFYRAENVEQSHIAGLGIGLFLVQEIVSLHGGDVTVESREGQGTTFTVRLPLT